MFYGDNNGLLARHRLEKFPLCRTQQMRITLGFGPRTGTVVKTPAEYLSSARIEIHDDKRGNTPA